MLRILVPQPMIKPAPPAVEAWSLSHQTTREVSLWIFKVVNAQLLLYKGQWDKCEAQEMDELYFRLWMSYRWVGKVRGRQQLQVQLRLQVQLQSCNMYRTGGGEEQQLCQWDRESSFKRNKRLSRDLPNIKVDWKARGILDKENSNDNFIIKISVVEF